MLAAITGPCSQSLRCLLNLRWRGAATFGSLTEKDLLTILTEPENNLCRQHEALVFTEGVNLEIGDDAKKAIARLATQINRDVENIGARRLHTIMERLTEELAFTATDRAGESVAIGAADVETAVESIAKKTDLSRFIL